MLESKIDSFEHEYNPMHFYCRLIDAGMNIEEAKRWTQIYEFGVYQEIMEIIKDGTRKESEISAALQHKNYCRE